MIKKTLPMLILFMNCIYTNVKTPGWYYSQSYADIKGMQTVGKLSGETCSESWFWLVYLGDESFETAVHKAVENRADLLFNVQTDYSLEQILFGFLRLKKCTRVTGIGVKFGSVPEKLELGTVPEKSAESSSEKTSDKEIKKKK
ncbi:MAG TPA: TRL domain-containing protein [Leptospiraceae bacterium]|nr:TRL domain-containing protein [Leptospiraceae bacterium]HMY65899.1 TRL domain-containing protein [Leptospiraceae bacterium]HMZ59389.1 TRL domain-containing protein [Leptospiraceae bacterium]HNF24702.1 TRL domain-containing protein [Leptospiraceae bacterium]HNM05893.1 TRL domain-containing protein [Leptospiraceae bacterium]